MTDNNDHGQRLAAVESRLDSLSVDIKEIKQGILLLTRTVSDAQKPQFATLAAWALVLLMVIGFLGSGYVRDIARIDAAQAAATSNLNHLSEDVARMEALMRKP